MLTQKMKLGVWSHFYPKSPCISKNQLIRHPDTCKEFNQYITITVLFHTKMNYEKIRENAWLTLEGIQFSVFQKVIFVAQAVDSWRIFPRAFLSVYMYLLYYTTFWFMSLPEPSFEQSGLISIVVGAGAAWFGLYAGTSGSSKSFKGEK